MHGRKQQHAEGRLDKHARRDHDCTETTVYHSWVHCRNDRKTAVELTLHA